jgi:baseplate J-like protein
VSAIPYGVGAAYAGDPEEYPNPNAEMTVEETSVARPNVETDTSVIAQAIFEGLAARAPGWVPHDSNLETWLIEEFATVSAQIRQEAVTVPEAIFQTYGEEVLGIPIRVPKPATGRATWTAVDAMGYAIPTGTQLSIRRTGDEWVVFEVTQASAIPSGQLAAADIPINASEAGAYANGLSGEAEVVDPLAWVDRIEIQEGTSGGDDGQDLQTYLELLVQLMRVVALRPILPWDFAILALRVPGVGRAVAMDGYEPSDGSWGHQRQISLVLTDAAGEPCTSEVKQTVADMLEALREVNFRVYTLDAAYLPVDVDYTVTAFAEQDAAIVQQACDQALALELSPATFRLGTTSPAITAGEVIPPPGAGTPGRQTLHLNDYIGLLDRQRGVDWVDAVTLQGAAADVVMPSPITLPRPGAITGAVTVQAHGGGVDFP